MILNKIKNVIEDRLGCEVELDLPDRYADASISPGQLQAISEKVKQDPKDIVNLLKNIAEKFLKDEIEKTELINGFFNIHFTTKAIKEELALMREDIDRYLLDPKLKDQTVVFDYSSPNIAKPFSVGHLRSTIIGHANLNCHKVLGYNTVGINHVGDWGTQFGKLIVAIKKWGNEKEIEKDPISNLNQLYVRFHQEQETNPVLNEEAREWFLKLEKNDSEARGLWRKCIKWSFKEFDRIYNRLGIKVDNIIGESFYEDKLNDIVAELDNKGLLSESEGALIVEIDNMPPALIKKSDGATLYMTRDLAALKYRISKYNPYEIIYHVGNDQALHFAQLEKLAEMLGWLEKTKIKFAGHGLLRLPEGKMSTRKGNVVLLDSLIDEAIKRATKIIEEKNPDLENKDEAAEKIGISAIKYSDLSQNRKSDMVFSFDRAVSLEGNSSPYLQYTYARASSLIRKYDVDYGGEADFEITDNNKEVLSQFLKIKKNLESAVATSSPNLICDYAYKIANVFNTFYEKERVLTGDGSAAKKIYPVIMTKIVLGKLFDIIGIDRLEKI